MLVCLYTVIITLCTSRPTAFSLLYTRTDASISSHRNLWNLYYINLIYIYMLVHPLKLYIYNIYIYPILLRCCKTFFGEFSSSNIWSEWKHVGIPFTNSHGETAFVTHLNHYLIQWTFKCNATPISSYIHNYIIYIYIIIYIYMTRHRSI